MASAWLLQPKTGMRTLDKFSGLLLLASTAACVSTGKYDAALADAQRAQTELNATRGELTAERADAKRRLAAKQAELDEIHQVIRLAQARCVRIAKELGDPNTNAVGCSQALDDATALNQQLRQELERQGKNVDQLLSAKGALASSLEQARARLDELRRAQAAAEARAALFRDFALEFKTMLEFVVLPEAG
jgi:chemotaxis protein MotB